MLKIFAHLNMCMLQFYPFPSYTRIYHVAYGVNAERIKELNIQIAAPMKIVDKISKASNNRDENSQPF